MDWRASESCGFVNCLANSPRPRFVQTAGCWMSDGWMWDVGGRLCLKKFDVTELAVSQLIDLAGVRANVTKGY